MSKNIEFEGTQRFLSIGETFNHRLQSHDEPYSFIITSTSITSKVEIQNKDVEKAFEILVKHHPLAQCTIDKNENGDFYFQNIIDYTKNTSDSETNSLPSFFKIKFSSISQKTDWIMEAYDQMKTCFKPGELLWRAVWLKIDDKSGQENNSYVVLFTFHHAAFDGKSTFHFIVNPLLSVLDSSLKNEDPEKYSPKEKIIPKSCEEIFCGLNTPVSEESMNWVHKTLVNSGIWLMKKLSNKENIPILKTYAQYESDQMFTKLHTFVIDESLTTKAVNVCKMNKVSVHSFLLTIYSAAIELTRSQFKECELQVKNFLFPIDLRKFNEELSEIPMSLGCYFSSGSCTVNPLSMNNKPEQYIDTTKKVYKQVSKQNKVGISAMLIKSLLPFLSRDKADDFLENIMSVMGFGNTPTLSNIGVCKPIINEVEDHIITVNEYYFTLTIPAGLALFVSCMNNKFMFCVAADGHWMDEKFLKVFEGCFKDVLKHACS